MAGINQSVGNGGVNQKSDVFMVQRLLNKCIRFLVPLLPLKEDGACGSITVGMIKEFQQRIMKLQRPDGRVDPGKGTWKKLVEHAQGNERPAPGSCGYNSTLLSAQAVRAKSSLTVQQTQGTSASKGLTEADYQRAAGIIGAEVAAVKAVATVESGGSGFLPNGKPKILFEGHWFSKLTKGIYDLKHPTISYKVWTKKHYKGGSAEYERYLAAYALNSDAAMKATSWGRFQIMGFNHAKAGYGSVALFVEAMHVSEGKQLEAFAQFLKSTKLDLPLKIRDWATFARGYNGPSYATNNYDILLKQAYEAYSVKPKSGGVK